MAGSTQDASLRGAFVAGVITTIVIALLVGSFLLVRVGLSRMALRVRDTIKTSRDGREVSGTLDRELLWYAQTPQGFDAQRLRRVLAQAHRDHFTPSDDAGLFERYEGSVALVEGDPDNIKLTTPADLTLGAAILKAREEVTR